MNDRIMKGDTIRNYTVEEVLSENNDFTEVLKCKNSEDGKFYVLKITSPDETAIIEHLMEQGQHENIIPLIKTEWLTGKRTLYFPYYTPVTKGDKVTGVKFETFGKLFNGCLQICNAVSYMYSKNIIHNDLKLKNLVYNEETNQMIVIDFDCALMFTFEDSDGTLRDAFERPLPRTGGTGSYKAPEKYDEQLGPLTIKSEVFSLGKIFAELYFGERMSIDIIKEKLNDSESDVEKEFFALIKTMLTDNIQERPSIESCIKKLMEMNQKYENVSIDSQKKRKQSDITMDSNKRRRLDEEDSSISEYIKMIGS